MARLQKPGPQRKNSGWQSECGLPFPNFALGKTEIPAVCRCIYDGTNFFVTNHLDMHTLHYNGSFGTSSLTFRGLSYDDTSFVHRSYYKKKRLNDLASGTCASSTNGLTSGPDGSLFKYFKAGKGKRIRVDVESSKSSPNLRVHIVSESGGGGGASSDLGRGNGRRRRNNSGMSVDEDNPGGGNNGKEDGDHDQGDESGWKENSRSSDPRVPKIDAHLLEEEKLILMPEEAIFLSFGVGCLAIYNLQGQTIDFKQCWTKIVTTDPDFPTQYAAYHYFRGKNWVPKNGNNYGGTYVLYETGPEFNHSSYIVHILESSKPKPTWMELAAWQRLATHASKHVLLCEVSVPKTFRPEVSEPRSIFDMKLKEMSLMRWLPQRDTQIS